MLNNLTDSGGYALIVSDALEIMLFGIYSILFTFTLLVLTAYKRPHPVSWPSVWVSATSFLLCMAHTSLVTTDRHTTFLTVPIPNMSPMLRGTDMLFKALAFLSQLIMLHRCWTLWDKRTPIVILPLVLSLVAFVCGLVAQLLIPPSRFTSPFVTPRNPPLDVVSSSLSLVVFVAASALIVCAPARKRASPSSPPTIRREASFEERAFAFGTLAIEAGALLAVVQVVVLALLASGHPSLIVAECVASQVYGMAPTLIIFRHGVKVLPPERAHWTSTNIEFTSVIVDGAALSVSVEQSGSESIELASMRDGGAGDLERGRAECKSELLPPEPSRSRKRSRSRRRQVDAGES